MDLLLIYDRLAADLAATVKSALVFIHLFGLGLGLGTATLLDLFIVRSVVLKPISREAYEVVEFSSKVLSLGLAVLWATGLGLLAHYALFDMARLTNGKIWAKIAIVAALTVNGVTIHKVILPMIRSRIGNRLLDGMGYHQRAMIMLVGAISVTSWYVPMALGALPQLNFLSAFLVLGAYGVLLALAALVASGLAALAR